MERGKLRVPNQGQTLGRVQRSPKANVRTHSIVGTTNISWESLCAYHCRRVKALRPVIFATGVNFHR